MFLTDCFFRKEPNIRVEIVKARSNRETGVFVCTPVYTCMYVQACLARQCEIHTCMHACSATGITNADKNVVFHWTLPIVVCVCVCE